MTTTTHETITADELLEMGDVGRCELIEGRLVRWSPAGFEHGRVVATIGWLIGEYVEQRQLGVVLGAGTGFVLARNPDTVRVPDAAFVSAERLKGATIKGYMEGAPDLAVEVNSPGDRQSEVLAKVDQWLAAGAQSVWLVDPVTRSVYRSGGEVSRYREGEQIEDEPALPGFSCKVAEIFE